MILVILVALYCQKSRDIPKEMRNIVLAPYVLGRLVVTEILAEALDRCLVLNLLKGQGRQIDECCCVVSETPCNE